MKEEKIQILFVHPPEGNAFEMFKSFQNNIKFRATILSNEKGKSFRFIDVLRHKLKIPSDLYNYNKLLLKTSLKKYQIIFIVKGNTIRPKTLRRIKNSYPEVKIVSWSLDDMSARHNRSYFYIKGLKLYDLVFTNKSYNVDELKLLGAKKVIFHDNKFSKKIHFPIVNSRSKYAHDVIFIGELEKERFDSMNFLAKNGIEVNVYTNSFEKYQFKKYHPNLIIHKGGLFGKKYSEAITNSKVTLCFLRKINRDLQTTRSVEIPACGGCMLAERTIEHERLFLENKEAMFFSNKNELLNKVKLILESEKLQMELKLNGLKRCVSSDYSYDGLSNLFYEEFIKLV